MIPQHFPTEGFTGFVRWDPLEGVNGSFLRGLRTYLPYRDPRKPPWGGILGTPWKFNINPEKNGPFSRGNASSFPTIFQGLYTLNFRSVSFGGPKISNLSRRLDVHRVISWDNESPRRNQSPRKVKVVKNFRFPCCLEAPQEVAVVGVDAGIVGGWLQPQCWGV